MTFLQKSVLSLCAFLFAVSFNSCMNRNSNPNNDFSETQTSKTKSIDTNDARTFKGINPHSDINEKEYSELIGPRVINSDFADNTQDPTSKSFRKTKQKMVHGPFIGSSDECQGLIEGVKIANNLIVDEGKCQKWFDDRGPVKGPFYVMLQKYRAACFAGAPTWTYPYYNNIGFCSWACDKTGAEVASLLIHELGHHYCPVFVGREKCAISAQDACQ